MGNKVILLAEDNPDDEQLIIRFLKQSHIENHVIITRDGSELLDYLFCTGVYTDRVSWMMPSMIILDIKLPKVGGLEVLKTIRSNTKTQLLPVVILTSSSEKSDMIESYELRVNSYIRKPFDYNQFQKVIEQISQYWLMFNIEPPIIV